MTVYELIQKLTEYKPNAKVYFSTPLIKTGQGDNLELEIIELKTINGKDLEFIVE